MARASRVRRRVASRKFRSFPYGLASCSHKMLESLCAKKSNKPLIKKDWEDAICSICMECPHNAVLLLCSSYDKGCRPYMCGTSCRYSNCLDQYKKAYTKISLFGVGQSLQGSTDHAVRLSEPNLADDKGEAMELSCPLCRGQVKGWTMVEPAREYLNAKKRSCMQENCTFLGTYKELRKHVRTEHPSARPHDIDPKLEQRWRQLEQERERDDVISTVRSEMPGAVVFGDYVIDGNHYRFDLEEGGLDADHAGRASSSNRGVDSDLFNVFMILHAVGRSGGIDLRRMLRHHDSASQRTTGSTTAFGGSDVSDQENGNNTDDGSAHHHGRVLSGQPGRRRRHRDADVNQRSR